MMRANTAGCAVRRTRNRQGRARPKPRGPAVVTPPATREADPPPSPLEAGPELLDFRADGAAVAAAARLPALPQEGAEQKERGEGDQAEGDDGLGGRGHGRSARKECQARGKANGAEVFAGWVDLARLEDQ